MKSAKPEASPPHHVLPEPSGDTARSSDGRRGLREHEELGESGAGGLVTELEVDEDAVFVDGAAVVDWGAGRL